MTSKRLVAVVLICVGAVTVLAACGTSKQSASTASTTTSKSSKATTTMSPSMSMSPPPTTSASNPPSVLVEPAAFEARIAQPDVVTINVHVPNEGSIAGTDLTIPYNTISTSTQLPANKATPLAVYCRRGNMSAKAVVDLQALGYTNVVELAGGFNAWSASGRPLV